MSVIKYVLNVFGLMFIVIGLTCNISTTCGSVFCTIGSFMYIFERQISLEDDAKHFSCVAKEFDLLLVPSDSFGTTGYVRICYCVSKKQIENSLPAFKKLFDYYKK